MSMRKAVAAAVGAVFAGGGLAHGGQVGQWIGDNYTSSASTWADSSGTGSNATVPAGITAPTATANVFNGHKAVNFPGGEGAGAPGWFSVSDTASNALGATSLTWVAVVKTSAAQTSNGAQFWQKQGLIGKEEGGAVNDWGFGVGGANPDVGVGAPDTTISGSTAVNDGATHVLIGVWNGTAGTLTMFVDGVQTAQQTTGIPTAARDANASGGFGLGVSTILNNGDTHVFNGQVAELRLYNDAGQNISALTSSLQATYVGVPEPASVGLLAVGGLGLLLRRRRPAM